jgi:hypothetical protein
VHEARRDPLRRVVVAEEEGAPRIYVAQEPGQARDGCDWLLHATTSAPAHGPSELVSHSAHSSVNCIIPRYDT